MYISLRELLIPKKIPERYMDEFSFIVNKINDTRKKNFFIFFMLIQGIIFGVSLIYNDIDIFSRIMWMSVSMIVISGLYLYLSNKISDELTLFLEFPILLITMLWSVTYVFIDYNTYQFNMIYIGTVIFLSVMHLGPGKIIKANLSAQFFFIIGLVYFSDQNERLLINLIDSSILVIMACFLAIRLYSNFVEVFLDKKMIQKKKEDLEKINKKIGSEIVEKKIMAQHFRKREEKFRSFSENSPSIILLVQHDKIIYANPNAVKITGYSLNELYSMKWWDLAHQDMRELVKKRGLNRQSGKIEIERYEMKICTKSGEVHWVDFSASKVMHQGKLAILWNAYDITDRKKTEKRLERLLNLKDSMFEIMQSIIGIDDIQLLYDLILAKALETIDHANVGSILILNEDDTLEVAAFKGYDSEKMSNFKISLEETFLWLQSNGKIKETIIVNDVRALMAKIFDMAPDSDDWSIASTISAPIMINQKLYGMVNIDSKEKNIFTEEDRVILDNFRTQIEIALKKHLLYEETINLSRYDKLTDAYNRRYFEELFEQHFSKAKEYNENFSLVIFDMNGLKIVNDSFGHLAGDAYIKKFATTLLENVRASDLFARYGGDEFIAVFFNMNKDDVLDKMEGIINNLEESPLEFGQDKIICSFSYGIASYPEDARNYKDLVKIADQRMYSYKAKVKAFLKN